MDRNSKNDSLDGLLREFDELGRAGVFRSTRLETAGLCQAPALTPAWVVWLRRPKTALSLAAVVVLAATVWTWMFRAELRHVRGMRDRAAMVAQATTSTPESQPVGTPATIDRPGKAARAATARFHSDCLTGPVEETEEPCLESDLVADGRIDLRDFSMAQLSPRRLP